MSLGRFIMVEKVRRVSGPHLREAHSLVWRVVPWKNKNNSIGCGPKERELQKAGASGETSWRRWYLHQLVRFSQAVRPEPNFLKRQHRKTWQTSPEPFLGVTLL